MCRWLAYCGQPILLEELLLRPEHSLIDQSLHATRSPTTTNGDGFGVGWYGTREVPGLFRDIQPAWNDTNLHNLTAQIESGLFVAHVRSATGTPVQRSNCHPFRYGKWLFVHNGLINEFARLKRQLMLAVSDVYYDAIRGSTDSELMFHLALTLGLEDDPIGGMERMAGLIETIGAELGVAEPLQMTLGVADGQRLYAVRYSSRRQSRTLFVGGADAVCQVQPGLELGNGVRTIVSEPFGDVSECWSEVAESTAVIMDAESISQVAFRPTPP